MALTAIDRHLLEALDTPSSEAAHFSRLLDFLVTPIFFLAVTAAVHIHVMLTVGYWDFWVDWKDRQYWVSLTPVLVSWLPAALAYTFWVKFRLPFAFPLSAVALTFGEWMVRIFGFHGWSHYPYSMVWPAAQIPGMLCVDLILMLTSSYQLTAILGGFAMGLLFFPANWPLLAPFHLPVNAMGQLASVADYVGYVFQRTSTPEYIRIIERGTLRTFGSDATYISAFFSALFTMISIFIRWPLGKFIAELGFFQNRIRRLVGFSEEEAPDEEAQAMSTGVTQ